MKKKLKNRRKGYNQKFRVDGISFYLRTGNYEDGTIGEIFINVRRGGQTLQGMMDGFCIGA